MASALNSSNYSFLLTSPPSSRLIFKTKRLRVFARKAAADGGDAEKGNSNPFRFDFDFGKVPDVKSLIPVVASPTSGLSSFVNSRRKDAGTVFVAGATGQAGIRIAQTLLREGFTVRAGVSDLAAAQELARLAARYKIISNEESKRLNAVESSFQDAESIAKAIGSASKVVVTVGSGEDGATGAVTAADALAVVQAAELAGVSHVAIVYDGGAENSSTYNVLDGLTTFFSTIFSRSQPLSLQQLLMKVVETNLRYTFIKTALTDDFSPESAYNVLVSPEGTAGAIDYKVATSQIASVVAKVFSNTAVAENKVVEVSTSPSAPSKPIDEFFSSIPEDKRRAAYLEAQAKAKAEEEASEAAEAAKRLEAKASQAAEEAREKTEVAAATAATVESLFGKAKDIGAGFSWDKLSAQIAAVQKATEGEEEEAPPKVRIATVRGTAKALSLPSFKAIIKPKSSSNGAAPTAKKAKAAPAPAPKRGKQQQPAAAEKKKPAEVRNVFGGLFKQETIYVDDD